MLKGRAVQCLAKQYCSFSEKWLPIFGPSSEMQYQSIYARVVLQKDINTDIQNEVDSGRLNYIVMARDKKKKMPSLINELEGSIVFVTQPDLQMMLQCLGETPVDAQHQAESVSRGSITDTIVSYTTRGAGMATNANGS